MSEDILKDSWMPDEAVSKRIRDRVKKAGKRFHANDNIAERNCRVCWIAWS